MSKLRQKVVKKFAQATDNGMLYIELREEKIELHYYLLEM